MSLGKRIKEMCWKCANKFTVFEAKEEPLRKENSNFANENRFMYRQFDTLCSHYLSFSYNRFAKG